MEETGLYQNDESVEMFLEVMSQIRNIFERIVQQYKLPMTEEERKVWNSERMNYWDYEYVLSGAYIDGFSYGMGVDARHESVPQELLDKGKSVYNSLKTEATHPMNQEERNKFEYKWLEKVVLYATQKGALLHGYKEGKKFKENLEFSRKLKAKGLPVEDIINITGLSIEEIGNYK